MIPSLSQEALAQYASGAQTIQEPTGNDYTKGVSVGRTIPAKWWNWLFSNVTKRIVQSRSDADNMLTEMKNVVTDAGLTPSSSDNTQLAQSVVAKTDAKINQYVNYTKALVGLWGRIPDDISFMRNTPAGTVSNEGAKFYKVINSPETLYVELIAEQHYMIVSKDLSNFVKVDCPGFSSFDPNPSIIYFNNEYLYLSNIYGNAVNIYSSTDCVHWEYKTSITVTDRGSALSADARALCTFVIGGTLYILRGFGLGTSADIQHTDLIYTSDGTAFNTELDIPTPSNIWANYSVWFSHNAFEPVRITDNSYLIGAVAFNPNSGPLVRRLNLLDVPDNRYAAFFRSPISKIPNIGTYVSVLYYQPQSGYNGVCTMYTFFAAEGSSTLTKVSSYVLHHQCSEACGDVAILQPTGSRSYKFLPLYQNYISVAPQCCAFTYDGVNIETLPSQFLYNGNLVDALISTVFKIDNFYYLSVNVGFTSGGTALFSLYKTAHLSSDYRDYITVFDADIYGMHDTVFCVGYDKLMISYTAGGNGNKFSADLGTSWHNAKNPISFNGHMYASIGIGTHEGDTFFNDAWFGGSTNVDQPGLVRAEYQTAKHTNRVIDHTLYLH